MTFGLPYQADTEDCLMVCAGLTTVGLALLALERVNNCSLSCRDNVLFRETKTKNGSWGPEPV